MYYVIPSCFWTGNNDYRDVEMAGHVFRRTFDRISGKFDRLLCHSIYRSQVQHHQKVYPFDNIDCADFCLPENVFIINFIANPRYIFNNNSQSL